ncbi:50S ribosomal protein L25 [Vibrio sp. SS-MA-C1-2]|uniref:50S ribosomal protein L25 n=1 Tax=Vibrio sp. SS-MA-C1-2 TaxID=2908646 RepID=UPI001F3837D0|nr:50S ribosomal protein L25 [Vibrio sp. SS-MA-C1-2]UJF20126.1 50S ribosomal protein L25 [Vibrio sp. SS-MA-C1-2]
MKFEVTVRTDKGTGASRRLRHTGKFPAIVYGGSEAPVSITLNHDEVLNSMDKPGFYDAIVLVIDGQEVNVKPQDVQRHAFKPKVEHMDFIRI